MEENIKRILLVEDEPVIALLETQQLRNEGYAVTHVNSGEQAVHMISTGCDMYDLILMDIDLGDGIDGTEAASRILADNDIPVLFLSSHTEKDVVKKTEKITSYGYVVKNSGIRVLDASIKMAFKLFDAHKDLKERKQRIKSVNAELQQTIDELQRTNSELEAANEQLIDSEKLIMERDYLLSLTGSIAKVGGWEYDVRRSSFAWTEEVARIHGFRPGSTPDIESILSLYSAESRKLIKQSARNTLLYGEPFDLELEMVTLDGTRRHLHTQGRAVTAGGRPSRIQGVMQDISDHRSTEQELRKINRMHSVISRINQLIIRAGDIDEIFSESCRIAVESGNFRMAWIGLIDADQQAVIPAVWCGHEDGYLSLIKKISVMDVPEGRGPTGTAIRENRYFYCNDIMNDPVMAPWRMEALKRGYRSSIALPIVSGGMIIGAFSIYSGEPSYFNDEEIRLLTEVTGDIGFGVEKLRADEQLKKDESAMRQLLSHRDILMKELHHRVKNNLGVVSGLLTLEREKISDDLSRTILNDARSRVLSIMGIYERLYLSEDVTHIDLNPYIGDLAGSILDTYMPGAGRISLSIELADIRVETRRAVPLGLIINELMTNALKYAYPGNAPGEIVIRLHVEGSSGSLKVSDTGAGLPDGFDPYTTESMGFMLVRMLAEQIGGTFRVDCSAGTCVHIVFGLD